MRRFQPKLVTKHKGHEIWLALTPEGSGYRCHAIVIWEEDGSRQVKILDCDDGEFQNARDARREGIESAIKWIDLDKFEFQSETTH
jgi:hypothetical protein